MDPLILAEKLEALFAEVDDGLTQAELTRLAEAVRAGPYHRSDASI